MARRTKEESLATRGSILDAAEQVFQRQGVSRTSLQQIAQAAGVSRGAIYWHFRDKGELFSEMLARVSVPLQETVRADEPGVEDPLGFIRASFIESLRRTVDDPQQRRVYEIAAHQAEYIGELLEVREQYLVTRAERLRHLERGLAAAIRAGQLPEGTQTRAAALAMHALAEGLIRNWLLDPRAFDLLAVGEEALDILVAGMACA
jgi:TetR/AcrR family acrAB operon transcriptional repressor